MTWLGVIGIGFGALGYGFAACAEKQPILRCINVLAAVCLTASAAIWAAMLFLGSA